MALTEMQKKIINDNPKASVRELAKMVKCSPATVLNYRKKFDEIRNEQCSDVQKSVQESTELPARANSGQMFKLNTGQTYTLTPDDLFQIGTNIIAQELVFYNLANNKLAENPNDTQTLWAQKQHADILNKMMTTMGKWRGMEKAVVDINVKNDLLTEKDIDNMSFDDITTVVMDQCQRKQ